MILQKQKPKDNKLVGKYLVVLFGKNKKYGYKPELRIRENKVGIKLQQYCEKISECKKIFNKLNTEDEISKYIMERKS